MTLNFIEKAFSINNNNSVPTIQFYKRGFCINGKEMPTWQDIILSGNTALSLVNAKANGLNYLKLFGGTEQRNLPSGYTQVNYVTNTAQTLIDTGVKFDFSKNYEIELRVRGVVGSWYVFQAKEVSGSEVWGISGSTSGETIRLAFSSTASVTSQITRVDGNIYYIKATINNGNLTLYVKDETAGTEDTATGTYTVTTGQSPNMCLFGNLTGQYAGINSNVYFARIKENGNYIMDYVPCKQSTTAGLYDKVTNTFKIANNLGAGADAVPSPDTPMDIVSNNGAVKAKHQSGLPLGYTLLDYIESTGTQYIDTGYKPNANTAISIKYYPAVSSTFMCLYGTQDTVNANRFYGLISSTQFRVQVNSNAGQTPNFWGINNDGTLIDNINGTFAQTQGIVTLGVDNKNKVISVKSDEYTGNISASGTVLGDNLNCQYYLLLLARGTAGVAANNFSGRLYSFTIKDNDVLVQNLIPARRNSDNVLGMYDLVSNTFFTNQGTGNFTAGNTVSDPAEIYTDGTVETVEVHTTGGTATAENLFKVGTYQDVQSVIDGNVTRKVGIKVLDGTENWTESAAINGYRTDLSDYVQDAGGYCTHLKVSTGHTESVLSVRIAYGIRVQAAKNDYPTIQDWTNYLKDQYNAGTPVIIVYPLATPTTEAVTGQPLTIQAGTNIVEITQASIDNLGLEVSYKGKI